MVGANPTCAPFAGELAARGVQLDPHPAPFAGALLATWSAPASMTSRPLGLFTCDDWRYGSASLRAGVLERLRRWVGGPVESSTLLGYGTILPDDWATTLFRSRCGQPHSSSFALYRIYGSAAGFAGVAPARP